MQKKGKIIAVASGKGGVGKTVLATNLLGVYSSLEKKALLIDMDLSCGGVSVMLNLPKGKTIYNLSDDILNNRFKDSDNYVYHYNDFVDILPSCKDPRQGSKIDSNIISQIMAIYRNSYDVIIVDTTHVPVLSTLISLDLADRVLFLVTDNPLDLRNSSNLLSILEDIDKKNVYVVLNNSYRNEKNYFSKFDMRSVLKHNIDYILPNSMYIGNINKYIMDGEILVLNNKLSFAKDSDRKLLIKIALDMVGEENENKKFSE